MVGWKLQATGCSGWSALFMFVYQSRSSGNPPFFYGVLTTSCYHTNVGPCQSPFMLHMFLWYEQKLPSSNNPTSVAFQSSFLVTPFGMACLTKVIMSRRGDHKMVIAPGTLCVGAEAVITHGVAPPIQAVGGHLVVLACDFVVGGPGFVKLSGGKK